MGALMNTLQIAGANIRKVGKAGGYGGAAAAGALWGAGIGGAYEWANGGSFWSGARSGAAKGAMLTTGYRAAKVGAMGSNFADATMSGVWGQYAEAYKAGAKYDQMSSAWSNLAGRARNKGKGFVADAYDKSMSNQLKAVLKNKQTSTISEQANGLYKTSAEKARKLRRK
jgi:hypothetical protein